MEQCCDGRVLAECSCLVQRMLDRLTQFAKTKTQLESSRLEVSFLDRACESPQLFQHPFSPLKKVEDTRIQLSRDVQGLVCELVPRAHLHGADKRHIAQWCGGDRLAKLRSNTGRARIFEIHLSGAWAMVASRAMYSSCGSQGVNTRGNRGTDRPKKTKPTDRPPEFTPVPPL